jgi:trk system potassium uptake protein TrkH
MPTGRAVFDGLVNAASAQTTTGFSTAGIGGWPAAAQLVLIAGMFVGAGVGSTGGGVKLLRLAIVARLALAALRRTAVTRHSVIRPELHGRALEQDEIESALLVIVAFLVTIAASWLVFLAYGYGPMESLFDVVSAVGTVGLSVGVTRPELEPTLKAVLCVNMLLGRLEILALLVVLYPRTWFGKRGDVA